MFVSRLARVAFVWTIIEIQITISAPRVIRCTIPVTLRAVVPKTFAEGNAFIQRHVAFGPKPTVTDIVVSVPRWIPLHVLAVPGFCCGNCSEIGKQ